MSTISRPALVVFSHLRWNFVFQRPQHLLSRLAKGRRILFVEEPVHDPAPEARFEFETPIPNVLVCRPHTPVAAPGFAEAQIDHLLPLVKELADAELDGEHVAWFYTPMALPLLDAIDPAAVVYDCMDELSAFLNAPPRLLSLEKDLLRRADVVFTGGPSLYRAKKDRHPNIHCFSSSVDARHFAQAKLGEETIPEAADQAGLARPRLGYFGVIDERIDLGLIDRLAESHPEWQISMVGPVAKIDPASLPKRPNIHYFGQRSYAELPAFLRGWDVCLMPFALNESTKHISPTKVLEYMAAERPIVSTSITDVVEPYGDFVYVADGPEAFLAACEQALSESAEERSRRVSRMREVLGKTSWDATAAAMERLIDEVVERQSVAAASSVGADGETPPVVVIGAGPTGLSAAYHLGEDAVLIEQNDRVGGWCRSIVDERGFTWDFAGHIMFSNDPYVHELYEKLLGENVHWQDREAWIYSQNVYTRYPFQGALYGLPPKVIKECIVGAIEARFGSLSAKPKEPAKVESTTNGAAANGAKTNGHAANGNGAAHTNGNGHSNGNGNGHAPHANGNGHDDRSLASSVAHLAGALKNRLAGSSPSACKAESITDCCGDGVMESTAELGKPTGGAADGGPPKNFEEFIYKVWGAGIAKHFAIPYNKKLWAVDLKEMETSWLGGRVPMPNIEDLIEGSLQPAAKPMGPNARFGYPLRGGFQALMDGFLPLLKGPLLLNSKVAAVSPSRREVTLTDGRVLPYEQLVSTMPLPVLIRLMGEEAAQEVREAAAGLRYVSVKCVNIGVGRENLTEKHWVYYPEETVFHRIFVQGNASPHCNPPGGFGLTCEITYSPQKPLPCDGDALIERCVDDCRQVGIMNADDPVWSANVIDMPFAYVVYDHERPKRVALIRAWLKTQDIVLAGRYSEWEYYNSDHAFLAGKKAAETCRERSSEREAAEEVATAS